VLTAAEILEPKKVHIVHPADVPNPNWLRPGTPSGGQQRFGDQLLKAHPMVLIPSVVSSHSWNLIFDPTRAAGLYRLVSQERFSLDGRLNPPTP
jgi:RES domain-containing protein